MYAYLKYRSCLWEQAVPASQVALQHCCHATAQRGSEMHRRQASLLAAAEPLSAEAPQRCRRAAGSARHLRSHAEAQLESQISPTVRDGVRLSRIAEILSQTTTMSIWRGTVVRTDPKAKHMWACQEVFRHTARGAAASGVVLGSQPQRNADTGLVEQPERRVAAEAPLSGGRSVEPIRMLPHLLRLPAQPSIFAAGCGHLLART